MSKVKLKENECLQYAHVKVLNLWLNSENEGYFVTDTLARSNVESSG